MQTQERTQKSTFEAVGVQLRHAFGFPKQFSLELQTRAVLKLGSNGESAAPCKAPRIIENQGSASVASAVHINNININ